jgi:hypothetical protein
MKMGRMAGIQGRKAGLTWPYGWCLAREVQVLQNVATKSQKFRAVSLARTFEVHQDGLINPARPWRHDENAIAGAKSPPR